MKFTAVGDFLVQQPYSTDYEGFETIKDYISKGDVRFFNLETTLNEEGSCPGSQFSGGSYLRAEPKALETAKNYGFNMVTTNNNHALDFFYDGFYSTLKLLNESGLAHAGVGMTLPEAAKPCYLKTDKGTVAMIAVSFNFGPSAMAGDPSKHYPGRPGVNGIRTTEKFKITAQQLEALKEIAATTGANIVREINRRDGYLNPLPEGEFEFSTLNFEVADKPGKYIKINPADVARVEKSIKEAKENADYVILSMHNHITVKEKEDVPESAIEFCHHCIDMGVDAVIGHGPHLIRAIEIYKEKPIFYSLGDFVIQLNSIQSAPAEFYEKHNVPVDAGIKELLRVRSDNGKKGLMYQRKMMETFIPYWETENGKLTYLELLPVDGNFDSTDDDVRGIPVPSKDISFMERLIEISKPFGTEMTIKDGKVIVKVK